MTTHMVDHLDAFYAEARRILMDGEIKTTPQSKEERVREAEAFTKTLTALSGCSDRLYMNVLGEADEEIGAMSETEKRDSFQIVTGTIEGNWDYPFARFANAVWNGKPASDPHASVRLGKPQMGLTSAHGGW